MGGLGMCDTGKGCGVCGKRVLIVGASSGVGMAAATRFVGDGGWVALLARGGDRLERLAGAWLGRSGVRGGCC